LLGADVGVLLSVGVLLGADVGVLLGGSNVLVGNVCCVAVPLGTTGVLLAVGGSGAAVAVASARVCVGVGVPNGGMSVSVGSDVPLGVSAAMPVGVLVRTRVVGCVVGKAGVTAGSAVSLAIPTGLAPGADVDVLVSCAPPGKVVLGEAVVPTATTTAVVVVLAAGVLIATTC
jgi:hypothetical protein